MKEKRRRNIWNGLGTNKVTAGVVNAIMIFATFALTLPAIAMPTRGWLKISSYLVVINALFSVVVGLYLWITTLRTKETFSPIWNAQTSQVQDEMQTAVCEKILLPIIV